MNKFYLSLVTVAIAGSWAQAQVSGNLTKKHGSSKKTEILVPMQEFKRESISPIKPNTVGASALTNAYSSGARVAANVLPRLRYGTLVGITCWDEQMETVSQPRVITGKNGVVSMIYMYGRRKNTNTSSIGYNRIVGQSLQYDDFGNPGSDSLNVYPDYYRNLPRVDSNWPGTPGYRQDFNSISLHALTNETGGTANEYITGQGWAAISSRFVGSMAVGFKGSNLSLNKWTGYTPTMPDTSRGFSIATAVVGSKVYTATQLFTIDDLVTDRVNSPLRRAQRVDGLIQLCISSDSGRNFVRQFLPYLNAQDGISGIRSNTVVIDAHQNTVAIALVAYRRTPEPGQEIVVFKNTNGGEAGSWTYRVVASSLRSDTNNWGFPTSDNTASTFLTDGAINLVLDNNNKVHLVYGTGSCTVDQTGYGNNSFFPNGGGLAGSAIKYWNEDYAIGTETKEIATYVDVNRDGQTNIISSNRSTSPTAGWGQATQGGCSMACLSVDQRGTLYATYSAIVEGTEVGYGDLHQKRDIYVVHSKDNGKTWSNPQNIAPLIDSPLGGFSEDASSGGGYTDEIYPSAIRRVGSDGVLHITWQSDNLAGLVVNTAGSFGTRAYDIDPASSSGDPTGNRNNWKINNMAYYGIPTSSITGQYIDANFPSEICIGAGFDVNFTSPFSGYAADNNFYVQLAKYTTDTSGSEIAPNFDPNVAGGIVNIGQIGSASNTGVIPSIVPFGGSVTPGKYKIRLRSSLTNFSPDVLLTYPDGIYYPRVFGQISGEYDIVVNAGAPTITDTTTIKVLGDTVSCLNTPKTFFLPESGLSESNQVNFAVVPDTAGNIFVRGNHVTVVPNKGWTGNYYIIARTSNACGVSNWLSSPTIHVRGPKITFDRASHTITVVDGGTSGFQWFFNPNDTIGNGRIAGARSASYTITDTTQYGLYEAVTGLYNGAPIPKGITDTATCTAQFIYTSIGLPLPASGTALRPLEVKAEANLAKGLNMYPNPASAQTTIELKGFEKSAQVVVLNQLGQVIAIEATNALGANQVLNLNTSGYAKGMYIVRVVTADQTVSRKLIIE